MADNIRTEKRSPVTLKIKFKSETIEQFIERYAVDVSKGGIFVRTKEPQPVGTAMKFEFQLKDASLLIAGEGTVVWTREYDATRPNIAPGMGVRFDRLADGSQTVLDRILTEKAKAGTSRPTGGTRPPFQESPTRVAPVPTANDSLRGGARDFSTRESTNDLAFAEQPTRIAPIDSLTPQRAKADSDSGFGETPTRIAPMDSIALGRAGAGPFNDSPTRITDAAAVEAMTRQARAHGARDYAVDPKTPLPNPMPFHGDDDDDLSDAAFTEATKIRSLDELAAASLAAETRDADDDIVPPPSAKGLSAGSSATGNSPLVTSSTSRPRPYASPTAATVSEEDAFRAENGNEAAMLELDEIPAPPVPAAIPSSGIRQPRQQDTASELERAATTPFVDRDRPKLLDTTPSPRNEVRDRPVTKPPIEPPALPGRASRPSGTMLAAQALAPAPAVAPPVASTAPVQRGPMIAVGVLAVTAVAAASVWFFVLRDGAKPSTAPPPPAVTNKGSAATGTAPAPDAAPPAVAGQSATGTQNGSAVAAGSATAPTAAPVAELTTTVITAKGEKSAVIEVMGTDQSGPSPLSAKLEKGKSYQVRATAPGWKPAEQTVQGGAATASLTLVPKPRMVQIETDPPGASISLDGTITGKLSPVSLELKSRAPVRITARKAGFVAATITVAGDGFAEEEGALTRNVKLALTIAPKPVAKPRTTTPPDDAGSGSDGTGDRSNGSNPTNPTTGTPGTPGTGTGSTPDTTATEPKPAEPKPAEPKPTESNNEPTPNWAQ